MTPWPPGVHRGRWRSGPRASPAKGSARPGVCSRTRGTVPRPEPTPPARRSWWRSGRADRDHHVVPGTARTCARSSPWPGRRTVCADRDAKFRTRARHLVFLAGRPLTTGLDVTTTREVLPKVSVPVTVEGMIVPSDEEIRALHHKYAPTRKAFDLVLEIGRASCRDREQVWA